MHLHFLGICGTFMGSLALLAREMGHEVSGCDLNVYPPMSTQLEEQGITIHQGYDPDQFEQMESEPDLVVIGNALSRGNPAVEYVLDRQLAYSSGPQWLSDHLLRNKWVLAVSGTHGKTTTTSMLAWILESAGFEPGFLIGGVPAQFDCSARLGQSDFFVIEADEYDTAFFDKRSKFVHYHPRTLIMNNLEYDHADIFPDITAIQKQFHHLVRLVPSKGLVIYPKQEAYLQEVIDQGHWSDLALTEKIDGSTHLPDQSWYSKKIANDGSRFELGNTSRSEQVTISWDLIGDHNIQNALAACVAAFHVGVPLSEIGLALNNFKNVKRRLELIYEGSNSIQSRIRVYDDFAHHPTAIESTLDAIREQVGDEKVIAVLEPRSNTMKMGVHGDALFAACEKADAAYWFVGDDQNLAKRLTHGQCLALDSVDEILTSLKRLLDHSEVNTHVVIMSNGGFDGLHARLIESLR